MSTPKILLLSRKSLELNAEKLKESLVGVQVEMAVALSPADATAAQNLTPAVAQFQYVTAIVADFPVDMAINEDGSVEMLGMTVVREKEPSLILEAK